MLQVALKSGIVSHTVFSVRLTARFGKEKDGKYDSFLL